MNKVLKYIIISIIAILLILIIFAFIYPVIFHFDCYAGGGNWDGFPNSCTDRCDCEIFLDAATLGCDCGQDKCWDGNKCVPNEEKYCERDDDCVPASCCHAKECVNVKYKPDCEGAECTDIDMSDRAYGTDDCLCKNNLCINKHK